MALLAGAVPTLGGGDRGGWPSPVAVVDGPGPGAVVDGPEPGGSGGPGPGAVVDGPGPGAVVDGPAPVVDGPEPVVDGPEPGAEEDGAEECSSGSSESAARILQRQANGDAGGSRA